MWHLRINLPKGAQDLYTENYERCWEKLDKNETNGVIYCVHGSEHSVLLRCQFHHYWSIDLCNSSKNPPSLFFFFGRNSQADFKIHLEI